jgi:hypothetical protein
MTVAFLAFTPELPNLVLMPLNQDGDQVLL